MKIITEDITDLSVFSEPAKVLEDGCQRLLNNGSSVLNRLTIEKIIYLIDSVCQKWLNPDFSYRRTVVEKVIEETGMSREVVDQGLDVELKNYSADYLIKSLRSEIGNPKYLDGFEPNKFTGGLSRVKGPRLISYWFSSTIPALPALSIIRGLLLKSPGIGRISKREQAFAPAFLSSLKESLPDIGEAIWLTTWQPELEGCLDIIAKYCDTAIIYGSPNTCSIMQNKLAPFLQLIEHGHKIGITIIGQDGADIKELASLAKACAYDITMFDQRACISPQVYLFENGGSVSPSDFSNALSNALKEMEAYYPASAVSLDEKVAAHLAIEEVRFRGGKIYQAGSGWVFLETSIEDARPVVNRRVVRVVPVDNIEEALLKLPIRNYLQNVALSVGSGRQGNILEILSELGASRICRPGKMPHPTIVWHHDGMACLTQLAKWTDTEML